MEATSAKKTKLQLFIEVFDYHTRMFYNVIEGISETDANNRLQTKANHPSWLAGSLTEGRFEMAKALGIIEDYSQHELFKNFQGIQDGVVYPVLEKYTGDWQKISALLKSAMENASEETLSGPEPFGMGGGFTLLEALAFSIDRESYVLGQLGLWRRLLGYAAMKYPE